MVGGFKEDTVGGEVATLKEELKDQSLGRAGRGLRALKATQGGLWETSPWRAGE